MWEAVRGEVWGEEGWRGAMRRRRKEEHCTEPTDNNELSLREWTLGMGDGMGGVLLFGEEGRRRRRRRFNLPLLNDVLYPNPAPLFLLCVHTPFLCHYG